MKKEDEIQRLEQEALKSEYEKAGGCGQNHQAEIAIFEKPNPEKQAAVERFKDEGNNFFKKKNYGLAAVQYRKGLVHCDYWFPEGEEEEGVFDALKSKLHLNLAACKVEQGEWEEVGVLGIGLG